MLLFIGLLVLSFGSAVFAESTRDIIVRKVYETFNIDKSMNTIEIMTNDIKSKNISYSQISVKPRSIRSSAELISFLLKKKKAKIIKVGELSNAPLA